MLSGMTSTPLSPPARVPGIPAAASASPEGGVGTLFLWHLAVCAACSEDLAQPFRSRDDREVWTAAHIAGTGHPVILITEGASEVAVEVRRAEGGFRYRCMGADLRCRSWRGPYATPQLALASSRAHRCGGGS